MIYKPVDPSLAIYVDGQKSRRQDNKVMNLATNPEQRHFPCLQFDGIDDYVDCGTGNSLNFGTGDFSIVFEVYRTAYGNKGGSYIRKRGGSGVGFDTRDSAFSLISSFGTFANVGLSPPLHVLEHHVFVISQTSSPYIKHYINGIFNNTGYSEIPSNIGSISNSYPLWIGYSNAGGINRYLSGYIIPSIYTRSLSASEAADLYHGYEIDTSGLVGLWLFNEGSGSVALDSSGNGNDGTIYGATRQDGKSNGTLIGGISYKNSPVGKSVLNFDGSTGYIRHPITNNYSSNMSCFVWAKAPFQSYLIGQYDTGLSDRSWLIGTDQANEKRMRVLLSSNGAYGSTTSKDYLTTAEVFDNAWHLYGFSWDSGVLRLFVDGREQTVTKTYDASFTSIFNTSSDIIVGARIISNVPSGFYTGQVGEYYVYKRTVSPSEGSILYNDTRKFYGR